jgi:S1-C subfamily serine protease
MNAAARLVGVVIVGAGAIAGAWHWTAHRAPVAAAPARPAGVPAPAKGSSADASARPAAEPERETSREEITQDVAARVQASYDAAKAKESADKLAADAEPRPELPLEEVISRSLPAVVRVETSEGLGSGFFIAPDTILTNVHVVGGAGLVTIRRAGGATEQARVESRSPELDIAIVKTGVVNPDQPTLAMGSASRTRPGQEVIALGSPLGLQNTVTRGIVSAVREVGGLTLVQTDAAINPGNSGGPLVDRTGRVVGITTMGMRSSVAQGLSFAVAIEHARGLLAGNRPAAASGTPVATLNDAMSGGKGPSDAERGRERATQAYEQAVANVARRADALDQQWRSFIRSCYDGPIVGSFAHPWFALYDARAMKGAVAPGCGGYFDDLRHAADDIGSTIGALDEGARKADVYPGTRRDLLRRYRLDNPAWTK